MFCQNISVTIFSSEGGGGGGGGTCYVRVPGDVPFSWVYFLAENSEAGFFAEKF